MMFQVLEPPEVNKETNVLIRLWKQFDDICSWIIKVQNNTDINLVENKCQNCLDKVWILYKKSYESSAGVKLTEFLRNLWISAWVTQFELDHNDGSLPIHRWTNGWLPLETIEKPSGPMVAGLQNHRKSIGTKIKTIVKPLLPMVCQTQNHR